MHVMRALACPDVLCAGMAGAERLTFKVVLLGEGCVGKTSLVLRYCQNIFNDTHKTTLQACHALTCHVH